VYKQAVAAGAVNRELVGELYQVADSDILELVAFDPAAAVKITIRRPHTPVDIGETDVYGALGLGSVDQLAVPRDMATGSRHHLLVTTGSTRRGRGTTAMRGGR
jgi:hypothetical protein